MKTILAKKAGFCFGVNRAVEMAYKILKDGKKVSMLGPIIHNPQVIEDLKERGSSVIQTLDELEDDRILLVRAHGIEKNLMDKIQKNKLTFCDATCPFVRKIHKIVSENSAENIITMIAGDANHPEVKGIRSYAKGDSIVFKSSNELEKLLKTQSFLQESDLIIVAQTTFSKKDWEKCKKNIKLLCTNAKIFDTICVATEERQSEAVTLSLSCDAMLIIGGRESSNTRKLQTVCMDNCPTYLVESVDELENLGLSEFNTIGITAGASTPACIIKEVNDYVRKNY